MVQKRDEALAKTQRRAMATLLEQGKIDSARIRVENIIRSDVTTELHEILELYCELLLARAGLLDASSAAAVGPGAGAGPVGCDPGLEEAVKSIIYAAPRTEIKELTTVRTLLAERFGKEFVLQAMENEGGGVSERVVKKLSVTPPREELVQGYLEEIAKAYGVDWPPGRREREKLGEAPEFVDGEESDGEGGGQKAKQQLEAPLSGEAERDEEDDARARLSKATPPKDFGPASPLHVNPPSATTDNIHPKVTLNKVELTPTKNPVSAPVNRKPAEKKPSISDGIPDVDELAKRFAALKR